MENNQKKAQEITDKLYNVFGTHTGIIFGIPPELKSSVRTIVGYTIDELEAEQNNQCGDTSG